MRMKELDTLLGQIELASKATLEFVDEIREMFTSDGDAAEVGSKAPEVATTDVAGSNEATPDKTESKSSDTKKPPTLDEVRDVLTKKSREGYAPEVKALISKYGAAKLSEIPKDKLADVLAEGEVIGSA